MKTSYEKLLDNINRFIRKYYLNQLVRGLLYTIATLGFYFLFITLLEYFSWFDSTVRAILFYSMILLSVFFGIKFIVLPLLKLFNLGKTISYNHASKIIGKHFSDIQDVLLNTLQLKELADSSENSDLIIASINQKTEQLSPFKFSNAISIKRNYKYLKFAIPPLLIILLLFIITPSYIIEPSKRLINYNETFEKPALFEIIIKNSSLTAVQNEDFDLNVFVKGNFVPDELYIDIEGNKYKANKLDISNFSYSFKKLNTDTEFSFLSGDYKSKLYKIKVLPNPTIYSFDVDLNYPKYTGIANETLNNIGDITVPEGTKAVWSFYTKDTRKIWFYHQNKIDSLNNTKSNVFNKTLLLKNSENYKIISSNDHIISRDSLSFRITVIPDLHPTINVQEIKDSIFDSRLYFLGQLKDDYGFSKLAFNYSVKKFGAIETEKLETLDIPINYSNIQEDFYYYLDLINMGLTPGDEINYYFEIFDNDGVNGAKSARSHIVTYKLPSLEEVNKANQKRAEELVENLNKNIKKTQDLQRNIEDFQRKMIDKKNLDWQDKKQLEQLIKDHKDISDAIEKIDLQNKEKNKKNQQYSENNQEFLDKQKQLEDLFEKLMTDEMKKLFEELQKMLDNLDKEKVSDLLKKMQNENSMLEENLDRNLELFKQLEFEQKFEQTIRQLEKLAEDQEKLANETSDEKKKNLNEKADQQKDLNKRFDDFKQDMKELKDMNKDLEEPNKLESTEQDEQSIDTEQDNSIEELEKENKNKASQHQKNSSNKMKQLSSKLSQMKNDMEMENLGEDIEIVRRILSNLVKISFKQEDNLNSVKKINLNDPKYPELVIEQKNIKDDMVLVNDSLIAMSKRQQSIESFILKELNMTNNYLDISIKELNERNISNSLYNQQLSLTSINNLANFLLDALSNMQNQMNSKSGQCDTSGNNPSSSGKSKKIKSMRQLQEQLNKQLNESRKQNGTEGMPGQSDKGKMSEKLARMAAQQEAIRREMQKIGEEMQKEGIGVSKEMKQMLEDMNKTETDIVNKNITQETINRQNRILTRMLESEKAEEEREKEERRESNEGFNIDRTPPSIIKEFNKMKKNSTEIMETIPYNFTPFYQNKTKKYINSFGKINEKASK